MQRGIDSFFKKITPAVKKPEPESPQPTKKRRAVYISSDEEEDNPKTSKPQEQKKTRLEPTHESPGGGKKDIKKPSLSKLKDAPKTELKRVNPNDLFGGETKRIEAKKPPKPKEVAVIELEDDDMNASLMDVDESMLTVPPSKHTNGSGRDKSEERQRKTAKKEHKSPAKSAEKQHQKQDVRKEHKSPAKSEEKRDKKHDVKSPRASEKIEKTPTAAKKDKHERQQEQPSTSKKIKYEEEDDSQLKDAQAAKKSKPKKEQEGSAKKPKKEQHQDLNSSVLSDEERFERKRMSAMLYQKYKNRTGCLNPGSKEVPKGKPNCLAGLEFLSTGVLESLERDELNSIIKELGGKVMTVVSKKLNYLIVGEQDAGPKKLAQAEEFNVKCISEDDFLDLIREKSGEATKAKSSKPPPSPLKQEKSPKIKKVTNNEFKDELKLKKEKPSPEQHRKPPTQAADEELNNNLAKLKREKPFEPKAEVKKEVDEAIMAWVDKYKPASVKDIIGQQGAASNVTKLMNWLTKWYINHDGKKKLQKPNPWAKNDDGSFYKAALLSGPPGIGKTTTATLVCKELGFDAVEFNASDTRSKRLLKEEVSELLSNKSLHGYFHGQSQSVTKKHVLIMDEVDGMAGNEDRGGIQELIGLIKESSVPIICMCNDRNHQKMRSLVNYCYDLRFNRPRVEQIKGRILSICFKEKFKIEPSKLEEIIAATNNDIRQSINHISLLSAGKELQLKSATAPGGEQVAQKDLKMGPWEVVRKVFTIEEHKNMSFNDKCDLFFHDYSLSPLFVQQNYLQVSPAGPKSAVLKKVALTADALSLGDLVDKRIRSQSAWSLLPAQAIFSSVMPGEYMKGHFTGQINFPGWLGKNSRATKRSRLAQEIHDHTRIRTSGSRLSIRMDYAPFLLSKIVRPLKEQGLDGVPAALEVLKEYHLLREDIDALIELTTWPGKKGMMDAVDGRVKAALTRAYNKEVMAYSYSATAGVKKKRAAAAEDEGELLNVEGEEEGGAVNVDSEEEKDDDLENDGFIKAKKKPAATTKASTSKASTSAAQKTNAAKAPKAPKVTKSKK